MLIWQFKISDQMNLLRPNGGFENNQLREQKIISLLNKRSILNLFLIRTTVRIRTEEEKKKGDRFLQKNSYQRVGKSKRSLSRKIEVSKP